MKILILVLASDTDERYIKLQSYWRRYMNSSPEIDCYFYKGDPTLQKDAVLDISSNTLWLKIPETWDTIRTKMKMAFNYFSMETYDYIFRTNLSSFVHFGRYIEYCKTIDIRNGFCSAVIGNDNGHTFPSGSGFTITPDVAKLIAEADDKELMDDVYVGWCLHNLNIPIQPAKRLNFHVRDDMKNIHDESVYHFRIKSFTSYEDDWVLFDKVTEGLRLPNNA